MMSPSSRRVTADAARHLSQQMSEVLLRHANIMRAGGMSTTEASAAIMLAVEGAAYTALGLVVMHADRGKRASTAIAAIVDLEARLFSRSDELLREVASVEGRAAV